MRYYVEINGISSLTLTGFAIKELPPISKPPIRTQKDEIDGRDGDIITKLGYGAYDKQIEVGLYGNDYDINEIISFFNSEGIITFSNEPDKYYNFTIVNQIDFEKLLKFKTATITFHCQPFKYKKNEEPIEVEYQYVSGEGTEITLDNTDEAALKMELFGNTEQFATEGLNIYYMNYADCTDTFHNTTITSTHTGFSITGTFDASSTAFTLINRKMTLSAGTYTLKLKKISSLRLGISKTNYAAIARINIGSISKTFTLTEETEVCLTLELSLNTQYNESNELMIYSGTEDKEWEPYTGGVPSPNPQYPQDIQVVSGDNEILVNGKNLCDGIIRQGGWNNTAGTTRCYLLNGIKTPSTSTTYTISTNLDTTRYKWEVNVSNIPLPANPYTQIYNSGWLTASSKTITINQEGYLYIGFATLNGTDNISPTDINTYNYQIEKSSSASTYEPYQGNTYNIDLPVENLWHLDNATVNGVTLTNNADGSITLNGTCTSTSQFRTMFDTSLSNDTYTLGFVSSMALSSGSLFVRTRNSSGALAQNIDVKATSANQTITSDIKYLDITIINGVTYNNVNLKIQLEKSSKQNNFTPYGTTPIELCKIGTYQDYIYKDSDKWYLHKEIGKVVVNGTENWGVTNNTTFFTPRPSESKPTEGGYSKIATFRAQYNANDNSLYIGNSNLIFSRMYINGSVVTDVDVWKTYLSNNNQPVYYPLATPTNEPIPSTLINQLEEFYQAQSKNNQTNISQINNDLPFYIKAITREQGSDTAIINNEGNIFSKPILELSGSGTIGVNLNGNQLFNVDLSDPNAVIIDSNKLEAYNPNSLDLMNRKVVGDIANLKFPEGTNELKFDGALTKATVTNYSRWL